MPATGTADQTIPEHGEHTACLRFFAVCTCLCDSSVYLATVWSGIGPRSVKDVEQAH